MIIILRYKINQNAQIHPLVTLEQNYPNPCSGESALRFGLPRRCAVTLRVFDLLGRTVATVLDGEMDTGPHSARFDAGSLANGTYTILLQADGALIARRMTVLRK